MCIVEILQYSNTDLKNIVTPVNVEVYRQFLKESGYDSSKTEYLYKGFKYSFSMGYAGEEHVRHFSPNLKLRVGSQLEIWNKVMVEVKAGRYAGPFESPLFKYFIQSPIGLVPKDNGKKTRLIFHLSYPRSGDSVNSAIPVEKCTVHYPDFLEAVALCVNAGVSCNCTKSDMSMAFRNVPLNRQSWKYLILKAFHPTTGKVFYFVGKCLPFRASISCAIFQEFSNSVAHLVKFRTRKNLVNYLDDYFFAQLLENECNDQVKVFLWVCRMICFPVSLEKTVWASTLLTFLGLLIDTVNQVICIPLEKLEKALNMIEFFLNKHNGKVMVLQVQRLAGYLNFLCHCIIPGRVFVRRLYSLTANTKLMPHHHINVTSEIRLDLMVWKVFLKHQSAFCRPFIDCVERSSVDIDMYSDASGNKKAGGFGAYCKKNWTFGQWDPDWMEANNPSIEYLELFGVAVAILKWLKNFKNSKIRLHCDNKSVVDMINACSSKCKNCMILLRLIVLESLVQNIKVSAAWVAPDSNGKTDALSRLDLGRFWALDPNMCEIPEEIPSDIWPLEKIWLQ